MLGVWIPVIKNCLKDGFEPSYIIVLFVLLISSSILAGYCLVVARRLRKGLTKESLRNICFIFSLIIYLLSTSIAVHILDIEHSAPEFIAWSVLIEILCMIPAGLFYWLTNKYLTRWLGFDISIDWQRRKKAAKNFFGLMALLIWMFCFMNAHRLKKAYDIDSPLLIFGRLLLPATLAFIFYKLSVRIVMHGCPKEQNQISEPEANLPV